MGILYLTTYAAFEFYALVPATVAFGAMVVVTVAAGIVAVVQNSRTLIVLGVAGGFLAPLLAATQTGDHVALFSYSAVLNGAILTIAWFKAWRILNLLGFAFTFMIAGLWGYQGYLPEHFATTEPFLVLFVLMYIGIAVLFALRRPPNLHGFVDSAVVFGTPFIGSPCRHGSWRATPGSRGRPEVWRPFMPCLARACGGSGICARWRCASSGWR